MDETAIFRTTYGRLTRLCAQALHDGFHRDAVYRASVGASKAQDPRLVAIVAQAMRLEASLKAAHDAGLTTREDLLPIAQSSKAAIEQEWSVSVPICPSSVSSG